MAVTEEEAAAVIPWIPAVYVALALHELARNIIRACIRKNRNEERNIWLLFSACRPPASTLAPELLTVIKLLPESHVGGIAPDKVDERIAEYLSAESLIEVGTRLVTTKYPDIELEVCGEGAEQGFQMLWKWL